MVTVAVAMVRPLGIGRLLLQSAWTSWPRGITKDVRLMSSRRCDVNSVNFSRHGVGGGFGYARRVKLRGCLGFEIRACGLSSGGGGEKGGKMKGDLILGIETSCDDTGAAVVMHFFPFTTFPIWLHLLINLDITMNYSGSVWTFFNSGIRLIPNLDKIRGIRTIYAQNLNGLW